MNAGGAMQCGLVHSVKVPVPAADQQRLRQSQVERGIEEPDTSCYVVQFGRSSNLPAPITTSTSATTQLLASADSVHALCLFSRQTLDNIGRITGHEDAITQVCFSKGNPAILWSSSEDKSVRCWDLRTQSQAFHFNAGNAVYSFDIGGSADAVLAAGAKEKVVFWDLRLAASNKQLPIGATFGESHTDDITRVRFHNVAADRLFTGSVDGLICMFDTTKGQEDDSLISVMPVDKAVATFGFCGPKGEHLYTISTDQTVALWNIEQGEELFKLEDAREALQNVVAVDYVIDCHYHPQTDRLYLISGTYQGDVDIMSVERDGLKPAAQLRGGHSDVVRCLDWDIESKSMATGGEDSKICLWSVPIATI